MKTLQNSTNLVIRLQNQQDSNLFAIDQYLKSHHSNPFYVYVASNASENACENASENACENASENASENAYENASENASENAYENAYENTCENTCENACEISYVVFLISWVNFCGI